jgi:hypothetical protein
MTDIEVKLPKNPQKAEECDPLRMRMVVLQNDFYTLCWTSLRKDIWKKASNNYYNENCGESAIAKDTLWENKQIGGEEINLTEANLKYIKYSMLFFILTVLYVLTGIIHQVFTGEIEASCSWDIRVLRILLVALVQMKLLGEFRQGLVKLKYAVNHESEFIDGELWLAKLIPTFQIICALASWFTLVLFICSEVAPLDMIQDFTGICVFTELDDWIGGHICSSEPEIDDDEIKFYNLKNVNERIHIFMKMSLLQMDTDIVEDLHDDGSILKKVTFFFYDYKGLVYTLPLICLPVEWLYLRFHPYAH